MMLLRLMLRGLLIGLCMWSSFSFGQEEPWWADFESAIGVQIVDSRTVAAERLAAAEDYSKTVNEQIDFVLNSIHDAVPMDTFHSTGLRLLTALAVIAFSWMAIRSLLTATSFHELLAEAVVLFIQVGLAVWVINGLGKDGVIAELRSGFQLLAGTVVGLSSAGDYANAVPTLLKAVIGSMLSSAMALLDHDGGASLTSPTSWIAAGVNMLFRFFMFIFLLGAALAYAGAFIATQILFTIGTILAPILVPFLVVQPLSFLALGWFKFMLNAGMAMLIGALLFAITNGLVTNVANATRSAFEASGEVSHLVNFGAFAALFLVVGLVSMLMLQSFSIASGIITGFPRLGSGTMPSKVAPAALAVAASGSVQSAAGSAGRAGAGVVSSAAGAAAGARAASSSGGTISNLQGAIAGANAARQVQRGPTNPNASSYSPARAAQAADKSVRSMIEQARSGNAGKPVSPAETKATAK